MSALSQESKQLALSVFGALLTLGGSIGYLKKGSKMSLLAGGGFGASIAYLAQTGLEQNKLALQGLIGVLFAVMLKRASGGAFMPRMIALLSLANLILVSL